MFGFKKKDKDEITLLKSVYIREQRVNIRAADLIINAVANKDPGWETYIVRAADAIKSHCEDVLLLAEKM